MGDDAALKSITLDVRDDGVYLLINKSGGALARSDVMKIVEDNRIRDIDFSAVNSIFKNENMIFEVLVSANTNVLILPETVKVSVTPDLLLASVKFIPPVNSKELLTLEKLKAVLADSRVIYGIDDAELAETLSKRVYNVSYVVAKGTPPVDGVNGYLVYHFDTTPKSLKPKERGDGTVDYKQLDLIEIAKEGDPLIEGIPPVEGSDGMGVTGKVLSHKQGKPHPVIHRTKNTIFSDDEHTLIAAVSGQLVYKNSRVEIFPVLQVSGDVNHSTGNIDFIGSVVIAGNVLTGFSVKAQGNIEVHGVMEGGDLHAGENVVLLNGAQGMERGSIYAKGSIRAKYIDQCKVYAGGDIMTDFILYSRVRCCGKVMLAGKRGLLLGGKATIKDQITAKTIGADLSASTEIELGFLPDDFETYKRLAKELNDNMHEFDKIESYEKLLDSQTEKGIAIVELDKKRAQNSFSKTYFEGIITELQEKINDLIPDCSNEDTCIIVKEAMFPGVRIAIGGAQTVIFENHSHCRVRNVNEKILIENLSEEVEEA